MAIHFDLTEKEAKEFMKSLDGLHLDYEFDYLFDDETDKEIGYSINLCSSFNVKYGE